MSKQSDMADSLELLLDTMCNTFGGIMFIAISLVVVSQLIGKEQLAKTPEEINEQNLQKIRQQVTELQADILALQKIALARQFSRTDLTPEQISAIKELEHTKTASLEIDSALEQSKIKNQAEQLKLAHQQEILGQEQQALAAKQKYVSENKTRLQDQQEILLNNINELKGILGTLQPREIRFALEVVTDLEPYWVLLQQGQIFRYGATDDRVFGEVNTLHKDNSNFLCMIPHQGNTLGDDPKTQLDKLFHKVNQQKYFISLVTDKRSFTSLLTTRQYLRNAGFKVHWSYNPAYTFQYSSNVNYRASE